MEGISRWVVHFVHGDESLVPECQLWTEIPNYSYSKE
jgi:hypothetical protein